MNLLLKNISWHNGLNVITGDVRIAKGLIAEAAYSLPTKKSETTIDFKNHFVYPGLINAHDHLEMNLYPKLGTPPYKNYVEWTKDIYNPFESPIKEIEKVDRDDRLTWGGIKNLISGVTTVVHHNPWHRLLGKNKFPVKVLKDVAWAHSLQLGKSIAKDFPRRKDTPFVIHVAEGIDELAFTEVSKLNALGLLKKNTVLVHAIGLTESDIQLLESIQCSVVWCPASNLWMFESTAPIAKLKSKMKVALGSDSTLTGSPTLLDEMKIASKTNLADSQALFDMVTKIPASIFNLTQPNISTNQRADLFIAPIKHHNYSENLLSINPSDMALVLVDGEPKLIASELDLTHTLKDTFTIGGRKKYIAIEIEKLKGRIEKKVGGKILERNPLWTMIEV